MAKRRVHSIYLFDQFRLDRDRLMLYRDETEVALPPKAVEILTNLVKVRGQIVSKDELIAAVWTDSIVEDSNLSQYLYLLRKTLGKRADGTPFIETIRRRGYRFTAEVRETFEIPPSSAAIDQPAAHSERRTLEAAGNVVTLANWRNSGAARQNGDVETGEVTSQRTRSTIAIAISLCSIGILVALSAAFYMSRSGAAVQEDAPTELNILRLTNGIEVMDATISPDGTYFVYHELDGKLYRMWLQRTGHTTRHEIITASERLLYHKTLSPDGQFVFFLASDTPGGPMSLYRVPTPGGPVAKIITGLHSPVSFSPDGRQMVYFRWDDVKKESAYVVRASDGSGDESVLQTWRNEESFGGNAAWSPDGKRIAYTVLNDEDGVPITASISVYDLDSGNLSRLSKERWDSLSRMQWKPDGRGIYLIGTKELEGMSTRRDQLYLVSYPQGTSRKITSEGSRHQGGSLGVTNEGAILAVPYNRSSQIWAMDPKGDSRSAFQLTTGLNEGRSGIAPLADGRIAYVSRTGETLNAWVMNHDGSDQKQITVDPPYIEELRSGGNGRYLVFSGYVDPRRPHIYRINTDGSDMRQLTFGDSREIDSSLSYDGKWIAYDSSVQRGTRTETSLWKMSVEGGTAMPLNRTGCSMPHFSPDDKYISCVRDQKDILILSADDGALITTLPAPPTATLNFGARWTPDGKAVVYIVSEKGVSNIWTHSIRDGTSQRLTDFNSGSIYHFAYSADWQRLFLARGNQIRDAILLNETDQ